MMLIRMMMMINCLVHVFLHGVQTITTTTKVKKKKKNETLEIIQQFAIVHSAFASAFALSDGYSVVEEQPTHQSAYSPSNLDQSMVFQLLLSLLLVMMMLLLLLLLMLLLMMTVKEEEWLKTTLEDWEQRVINYEEGLGSQYDVHKSHTQIVHTTPSQT